MTIGSVVREPLARRSKPGGSAWENDCKYAIAHSRFSKARQPGGLLDRIAQVGGQVDYILFVLMRYWVPTVLPPAGRERLTKNDADYWLESEQMLKAAAPAARTQALDRIAHHAQPLSASLSGQSRCLSPVTELELSSIVEGIAEAAGSYGGPDYTSIVKAFDPVPLRQTQPFKHNKKHSAELWVVFLLREHFRSLGLGKDRYWPLIAPLCAAAGILTQNGQAYGPDELKSPGGRKTGHVPTRNWSKNRKQLTQEERPTSRTRAWFQAWITWQRRALTFLNRALITAPAWPVSSEPCPTSRVAFLKHFEHRDREEHDRRRLRPR